MIDYVVGAHSSILSEQSNNECSRYKKRDYLMLGYSHSNIVIYITLKTTHSLPGMHRSTGWLLCQKMRSSLSSQFVSSSLSSFIVFMVVVTVLIIIEITPLPARN